MKTMRPRAVLLVLLLLAATAAPSPRPHLDDDDAARLFTAGTTNLLVTDGSATPSVIIDLSCPPGTSFCAAAEKSLGAVSRRLAAVLDLAVPVRVNLSFFLPCGQTAYAADSACSAMSSLGYARPARSFPLWLPTTVAATGGDQPLLPLNASAIPGSGGVLVDYPQALLRQMEVQQGLRLDGLQMAPHDVVARFNAVYNWYFGASGLTASFTAPRAGTDNQHLATGPSKATVSNPGPSRTTTSTTSPTSTTLGTITATTTSASPTETDITIDPPIPIDDPSPPLPPPPPPGDNHDDDNGGSPADDAPQLLPLLQSLRPRRPAEVHAHHLDPGAQQAAGPQTPPIGSDQVDFELVALHELLHGLGFTSNVLGVPGSEIAVPQPIVASPMDPAPATAALTSGNNTGSGTENMNAGGSGNAVADDNDPTSKVVVTGFRPPTAFEMMLARPVDGSAGKAAPGIMAAVQRAAGVSIGKWTSGLPTTLRQVNSALDQPAAGRAAAWLYQQLTTGGALTAVSQPPGRPPSTPDQLGTGGQFDDTKAVAFVQYDDAVASPSGDAEIPAAAPPTALVSTTSSLIVETSLDPYLPGSSGTHADMAQYRASPEFLMIYKLPSAITLAQLTDKYHALPAGIGPVTADMLRGLGYRLRSAANTPGAPTEPPLLPVGAVAVNLPSVPVDDWNPEPSTGWVTQNKVSGAAAAGRSCRSGVVWALVASVFCIVAL
ncbi:hypothetical protein BC828DRAFT_381429 [Blastocladiella britannica]|nr:hypothetical protein BC828DRAFT_381429 [Blastocladiella britannica]